MKTLLVAFALSTLTAAAQLDNRPAADFTASMTTPVNQLKTARTPAEVEALAGQFERLSAAHPKEWLAPYWTAYTYTVLAWMHTSDGDRMDGYLEKAEAWHTATEKIQANDETAALAAYIAQARLTAAPWSRWQTYGAKTDAALAKARQLNPANPRPDFIEAQAVFYKPWVFGGGKKRAYPLLKRAEEKYAALRSASAIHPDWDRARLKTLLAECTP